MSQNGPMSLEINVLEKKTKTAIKANQVSIRIDYEIVIKYILNNQIKKFSPLFPVVFSTVLEG